MNGINGRSLILLASMGLALLVVIAACSRTPELPSPPALPKLQFDNTETDLGQIPVSFEAREVRFTFQNRGQSDLTINQLVTSCGCAAARVDPDVIPPEQYGAVVVAIRTLEPEVKLAWVTVHANDPRHPRTTLELRWRSVAPLELDPMSADFGEILPNSTTSRTVRVIRRELAGYEDEGEIQRIESFPRGEVAAVLSPEGIIEITVNTGTRTGVGLGHLDVYLTGAWRESLRLPLRWVVRDTVQASPSELFVGSGGPESNHERNIVITTSDDLELSLESVSLMGDVAVTNVPWTQSSPSSAIVHLHCRFPNSPGAWISNLVVVSRHPEEHVLHVPVSGYVVSDPESKTND